METDPYLRRFGVGRDEVSPDLAGLARLQRRHLLAVPFENLDIHWKTPITLDIERFYDKIAVRRRGGFCYELNGLFAWLLSQLGFRCRMISARVHRGDGSFGAEFGHLAIIVTIGGTEYLADVGFGDFTAGPLELKLDAEQTDATGRYVVRRFDETYLEVAKEVEGGWKCLYIFSDKGRELSEFAAMCDFHQTSPESPFTQGKLASQMTETGRKTLTEKRYIDTTNGRRSETEVDSDGQFYEMLSREFGISAPVPA